MIEDHFESRDSDGNRTRVTAVKGRCLNRLTTGPNKNSPSRARTYNNSVNSRVLYHWAIEEYLSGNSPSSETRNSPQCSTIELSRITNEFHSIKGMYLQNFILIIIQNTRYTLVLRNHPPDNSFAQLRPFRFSSALRLMKNLASLEKSLRSISDSQLNTLLCLHLCPINLVVFKGSYVLIGRDISSWGGLPA